MRVVIELSGRGRMTLVAAALAVALATPAAVVASHLFSDVPDSSPYHADISALALAGVTTGCGAGVYCPAGNVSREQMAAFMHRSSGRAAGSGADELFVAPDTEVVVASLSILTGIPGTSVGHGFLKIDGAVSIYEDHADECDCFVAIDILVDGVAATAETYVWLDNDPDDQLASGAISVVVPVASGTRAVQLVVMEYIGTETLRADSSLTAMYVPFGAQGTDASAPAAASAQSRSLAPGLK
jgi:hypothetical protein